jgi:phosphodiesterase/alkaline phosphatase D-like protein
MMRQVDNLDPAITGDLLRRSTAESSCSAPQVRFQLPERVDLAGYRNLHALYKSDPSLQAAHAWHPFLVTWDDHEVDNDYAATFQEDSDPAEEFLRRRGRLPSLRRAHALAAHRPAAGSRDAALHQVPASAISPPS